MKEIHQADRYTAAHDHQAATGREEGAHHE